MCHCAPSVKKIVSFDEKLSKAIRERLEVQGGKSWEPSSLRSLPFSFLCPAPSSLPPSLLHFIRFFPAAAVIGTTDFLSPPSVRPPVRLRTVTAAGSAAAPCGGAAHSPSRPSVYSAIRMAVKGGLRERRVRRRTRTRCERREKEAGWKIARKEGSRCKTVETQTKATRARVHSVAIIVTFSTAAEGHQQYDCSG